MQTGDLPDALATTEKAMQLAPLEADTILTYTRAQMMHGDLQKLIASWQQWAEKHPKDADIYALLGMLEQSGGNTQKATDYYEKALKLQPEQPIASNNLAYLLTEQNRDLDRALSLAQSARRSMPDSANSADTLARVYYKKGMYASARDLLEEALKKTRENASMHLHLGMTYTKLSDKKDAAIHLDKVKTLAPGTEASKAAEKALAEIG